MAADGRRTATATAKSKAFDTDSHGFERQNGTDTARANAFVNTSRGKGCGASLRHCFVAFCCCRSKVLAVAVSGHFAVQIRPIGVSTLLTLQLSLPLQFLRLRDPYDRIGPLDDLL
jgi:hypothetical protein